MAGRAASSPKTVGPAVVAALPVLPPPVRPGPPAGLLSGGRGLWKSILEDVPPSWEPDARDLDVLREACELQDTIMALKRAIKRDGEVLDSGRGPRVNPAVVELRQSRVAKMRLLAALDVDARPSTPMQRRASKAGNARWANHRDLAARREALRGG